jgi:hypothetical protein
MTKEDKELLIKDLCARLPYGVIVDYPDCYGIMWDEVISVSKDEVQVLYNGTCVPVEICKPYLRPMSSMTDDERKDWFKYSCVDYDCEFKPEPTLYVGYCHLSVDWLNAHHFDYRGLISMGLALEAPGKMYKQ